MEQAIEISDDRLEAVKTNSSLNCQLIFWARSAAASQACTFKMSRHCVIRVR